jgi:glycoside/pentoside/hexuronide:cation symporter, GPH family
MINTSAIQQETVPVKSRIWISTADASIAILQALVAAGALTYYYTNIRGLELFYSSLVWLLFGLWNAVNDPLFGYISDRTKTKLGRRIPYIRFGAPLIALSFISLWVVIPGTDNVQWALFLQMLMALFLYDTLYTAIATSIYIMPYEMAVSNRARSSIYLWKIIFMVFTIVVPLGVERLVKPVAGNAASVAIFVQTMVMFGIGLAVLVLISTLFYREKHYAQEGEQFGFIDSIKRCFSNRSFLLFETISFTIIFVQTALMAGLWYYFDEINVSAVPLYFSLAAGIVAGVVLWISMRDRWGVKKSVRLMSLLFSVGCFLILLGGRLTLPAAAAFFLFGIGFAGGMYLIPLMNGDVIDMDEHRTGLRREGMYAGVNSLVTKPAISIAQAVLLNFMAAFGYNASLAPGSQTVNAETGILLGWVFVPGVLLFTCFVVLRWYPLAGSEWDKIKAQLAEIHAKKEQAYLDSLGYGAEPGPSAQEPAA